MQNVFGNSLWLFLTLYFPLASCNDENQRETGTQGLKITYTQGVWVNPDSAAKPVTIPAGEPTVIPAGEPTVTPANLNVRLAGTPKVTFAVQPKVCTPGTDSFSLPTTVVAHGKIIPAGEPEIIIAKDAAAKDVNPSNFSFFKTLQGLKHNTVRSIIQDKTGHLWFGTYGGGICKYDGKFFANFTEKEGLSSNFVTAILQATSGDIWICTDGGGVCRYNGRTFTKYTFNEGLASDFPVSIIEDNKENIWIGTNGGGVSCFDGNSFTNFTSKQGLSNNHVFSIFEDNKGKLWFGTNGGGVSCYDGNSFTSFTSEDGLSNDVVFAITTDKSGKIWFATYGGGACCFDGTTFTNYSEDEGLINNQIYSIAADKSGNIWFGTQFGACRYDGKSFTTFNEANGLSNNVVFNIFEDNSGKLWFATQGGGVCRYDGNSFTSFKENEGLANNFVNAIHEDKAGRLWFGMNGGGACFYDGNTFTNYTVNEGLANNFVISIGEDKSGNIWFGTYGGGVSCYDGKSFTNYTEKQGLSNSGIYSILEDKNGNIWFGTYGGGACCFDGKSFIEYNVAQGLADVIVYTIFEDKSGNLWFGTHGGGVSRYDGKSFTNFSEKEGLINNVVYCITENSKGDLWFGTNGGVCYYDGKSLISFTEEEGLVNNAVLNAIEDADGNIWFGTRKGISEITAEKFEMLNHELLSPSNEKYDPIQKALFFSFSYNDGFLGLNCRRNSVFQARDSRIWWGADFLMCYDPQGSILDIRPPAVYLAGVKLYGENISWSNLGAVKIDTSGNEIVIGVARDSVLSNGVQLSDIEFDSITPWNNIPQRLSLPYNNSNITFSYVGVHMQSRNHIKYQYKLEGLDEFWSSITERTEAPYGNVPPGEYVFKVKAMNQSGVWSEPFEYAFEVRPPWWETTWFRSGAGLFIIASVVGFFRFRTRQLRVRQKELEQTVEERTAEVVEQKHLVEEKQKDIIDSINYAQRIQHALLASDSLLQKHLPEYFVMFCPKDIVSGDFYWASVLSNEQFALVTADSTGHGVPGAIMSMLNISCLKESVKEGLLSPAEILNRTRQLVIETLAKDGSADGGKDGMDCSLVSFDFKNQKLTFTGGNNPVWIVRNMKIIELDPDKMPVGKHDKDNVSFTEQNFELQKGDCVYTLTDGMPDQFGGPKGKKFKYKPLKELLISIAHEPMDEQKKIIQETFENWKGDLEQVDDVTIVGIRI